MSGRVDEAEMYSICGSPIEQSLLRALIVEGNRLGWRVFVLWPCPHCSPDGELPQPPGCGRCFAGLAGGALGQSIPPRNAPCLSIRLQWCLGPHRVDFFLWAGTEPGLEDLEPGGWRSVEHVVECDGHEAHASREQRTADAQRDRFLTEQGHRVLRFTGSEIWRNPAQCASEALRILQTNPAQTIPSPEGQHQRGDA